MVAGCAAVALALLAPADGAHEPDGGDPRPTPLVERARSRLVQVEISATGPPGAAASLRPDDLVLKLNLRRIREFVLDVFCAPADASGERATSYGPGSYLFYFDQPHLTLAGRQRALDLAGGLVEQLIRDGASGTIVSNAGRLAVIEPATTEAPLLLDALRRLERDRTQWDFYAEQEDERVADVVELLNTGNDVNRAIAAARSHQRAEHVLTDRTLRRLAVVLGRLAEAAPPKVVLYFADALRSNPGEHYLEFFGTQLRRTTPALRAVALDTLGAGLPFDRVVNEAVAHGIRFYPVLAQGLVAPRDRTLTTPEGLSQTRTVPDSARVRFRDAENALGSLGSETGGHAFLRGESARRIAGRIEEDRACLYVASFDPAGFQLDAALRISVESRRDDVRLRARGRVLIQSERARLATRLLGAFSMERAAENGGDLRAQLIPTGFDDGRWRALLQISVPGTPLPEPVWDLGASVIQNDAVRDEVSGRLSASRPDVALVLEHELRLRPGRGEVVAVAHETTTGHVLSEHLSFDWPEPDLRRAVGGPISLLQPAPGAFLRGDRSRSSGSLAQSEADALDSSQPAALMSLVCRGSRQAGRVSVERLLAGDVVVDFPPLAFDLGADLCAQVRDVIPAESLPPGSYSYEIRVLQDGSVVHRRAREFRVAAAQP